MQQGANGEALLDVRNLKTYFYTDAGVVRAVDGVTYALAKGETLGLVGESGCGKSVSALSVMGLIDPPGKVVDGEISLAGEDLLALSEAQMRRVRGNRISMIFQEPMTSLNPVLTVGKQIIEGIRVHQDVSRSEARQRAIAMLRKVKISAAESRVDEYPHHMSGGMRQRVMIAMALACEPEILIADEPTTALDVTIQAQIMELLEELQAEFGMSVLLITHNLALIAEVSDHIAVMYASKIAEYAATGELFANPLHPYTVGLLTSIPRLGMPRHKKLNVIPGAVPNPLHFPSGCKFHPRCPLAEQICRQVEPPLEEHRPGHWSACHLVENGQLPMERAKP
jgi:oligopeptide/dipeptide ABC transporter ATP-binding protein